MLKHYDEWGSSTTYPHMAVAFFDPMSPGVRNMTPAKLRVGLPEQRLIATGDAKKHLDGKNADQSGNGEER